MAEHDAQKLKIAEQMGHDPEEVYGKPQAFQEELVAVATPISGPVTTDAGVEWSRKVRERLSQPNPRPALKQEAKALREAIKMQGVSNKKLLEHAEALLSDSPMIDYKPIQKVVGILSQYEDRLESATLSLDDFIANVEIPVAVKLGID